MAARLGVMGVCLAGFARCWAQDVWHDGFSLADPALVRASSAAGLLSSGIVASPMSFAWMVPMDTLLPAPSATAEQKETRRSTSLTDRVADRGVDWTPKFDYATAEIGFLYGRSTGKYGGAFKQAYITGETGNDKTQIFVGASYEDSSFQLPRRR